MLDLSGQRQEAAVGTPLGPHSVWQQDFCLGFRVWVPGAGVLLRNLGSWEPVLTSAPMIAAAITTTGTAAATAATTVTAATTTLTMSVAIEAVFSLLNRRLALR